MKVKVHGGRGSCAVAIRPSRIEEITRTVFEFAMEKGIHSWEQLKIALAKEPRAFHQIYGGATTCVEVMHPAAGMPIFIDAGTGFTSAGTDPASGLNNPRFKSHNGQAAILLTHTHWDHIIGLPTVEQVFKPGNTFHFYGVHKDLRSRIAPLFVEEQFPVPFRFVEPNFRFHQIPLGEDIKIGALDVSHFAQVHPGGSFAYRISDGKKVFVLATDTELRKIEPPHMQPGNNMYTNADVLMLDAQFSPEDFEKASDYGHASIFMAVDFAVREKTKRLYLFHQSPTYSDTTIQQQLDRARSYLKERHPQSKLIVEMTIEEQVIEV